MNVTLGDGNDALSRTTSTSVLCHKKKIVGHRSNRAGQFDSPARWKRWRFRSVIPIAIPFFFSSPFLSEADRCLPAEHHNFTMLDSVHVSDARVKEAWHMSINLTQESTHSGTFIAHSCHAYTLISYESCIHAISDRINCYKLHTITYSHTYTHSHTHTHTHTRARARAYIPKTHTHVCTMYMEWLYAVVNALQNR